MKRSVRNPRGAIELVENLKRSRTGLAAWKVFAAEIASTFVVVALATGSVVIDTRSGGHLAPLYGSSPGGGSRADGVCVWQGA